MFCSSTKSGLALVLTAMVLCTQAIAADGDWDPSWIAHPSDQKGIPGLFEDTWGLGGTGIYSNSMTSYATAVQNDGKVVVVGFGWNTSANGDQNACVVRRYNVDGSVDASFGNGGADVLNWSNGNQIVNCYFKAVALQSDGKIVAAGQIVYVGGQAEGIVQRFNSDGSWDGSFNSNSYAKLGVGTDANGVKLAPDGDVLVGGGYTAANFNDLDFGLFVRGPDGSDLGHLSAAFDHGGAKNDVANALVLQSYTIFQLPTSHHYDVVYLVGAIDNAPYASGQWHRSCGVVAFKRSDGGAFGFDSSFNSGGTLAVDFPVGPFDTDTLCRAAVGRPQTLPFFFNSGVVVGGERYFTPNGAPLASASYYALAEIDASGAVTRHDDFAFFYDLNEEGAYNSINGFARDHTGNLVVAGYAGIGAGNSPANHQPSDGVIRRFNADFTVDGSFGDFGTVNGSLDSSGVTGILANQREWFGSLDYDPVDGRIVAVGERTPWIQLAPNLYSWFLGVVRDGTGDRIFADGFDG